MGIAELLRQGSRFGVFGTGGHGRELAWIALQCGIAPERMQFIVDPAFQSVAAVDGRLVLEIDRFSGANPGAPVFVGVGDPSLRRQTVGRLEALGHWFPPLVSPYAVVAPSARLDPGVVVFHGATVSVNVELGAHVHVNVNGSVSHDARIGAYSSLSPGAKICGWVETGEAVFIGANACVINSSPERVVSIGAGAFVAAGACVTASVAAGSRVAGVPATPMLAKSQSQ